MHPQRCTSSAKSVGLGLPAMHRLVPLRYAILLASGFGQRKAPTVDAANCTVRVKATPGQGRSASADVSGAAVTIRQSSGRRVTTTLTVKPPACAAGGRAAVVAREPRLRVNTDRRPGRWKVKGAFSIAAAFGTEWTTLEGCRRTVTMVRRGVFRSTTAPSAARSPCALATGTLREKRGRRDEEGAVAMRRALLVGINDYPSAPLSGCVNDANAMERSCAGTRTAE